MAKRGVVGVKESSSGKKIQMKTKREGVLLLVQAKGTAKRHISMKPLYL